LTKQSCLRKEEEEDDDDKEKVQPNGGNVNNWVKVWEQGFPKPLGKSPKGWKRWPKNARKSHLKRMAEIKSGKRKRYAGESFNCSIM